MTQARDPSLGAPSLKGAETAVFALTERQQAVLRALVAAYLGGGAPVSSGTIADLLTTHLSSASVRNTLAELAATGLIEKPHHSAGRVPTDLGIRLFLDHLLGPGELGSRERYALDRSLDVAPDVIRSTPQLLYEQTRQLGFLLSARVDRVALRSLHFARVSRDRALALVVTESGRTHERLIEAGDLSQAALDRMAGLLNERILGSTLEELRERLEQELASLRDQAGRWLTRALVLGLAAVSEDIGDEAELLLATRLALLDHPEFADVDLLRDLLATLETKERLVDLIGRVVEREGVSVALGDELEDPALRQCAVVVAPYRGEGGRSGVLGVLGPSRMDYKRVIPLVQYTSTVVSRKLGATVPGGTGSRDR